MKIGYSFGGYGRVLSALAVLAACFTAAPAARADTLHAVDDAYVNLHLSYEKTKYGGSGTLVVAAGNKTRHSFMRFDLSILPAGTVVEQARLRLFVKSVPVAGDIDVYLVDETWLEDKIKGKNAPLFSTLVATVSVAAGDAKDFITIPLTLEVQDWLDGVTPNYGIVLVANPSLPAKVKFNSKEDTSTSHPPELEVIVSSPSAVLYTRWGRTDCPAGASLVYEGVVGGKHYTQVGSGSNLLCLSNQPTYNQPFDDSNQDGALIYGAEYETAVQGIAATSGLQEDNAPCAVCLRENAGAVIMQPGRELCPTDFSLEYDGYLMAAHYTQYPNQFICVDGAPEGTGATANENPALLYHVEGECAGLPCAAGEYVQNRELTCSVCTR